MVAKNSGRMTLTTPSDREIVLTRVFDAPRRLVFDAMTKCEHLTHWYGPRGYTLPVCEVDLRSGGAWHYVVRGPNGSEMGMKGVFREIVPPERVVSTESYDIPSIGWTPEAVNTVTMEERDGKTTVTTRVLHQSVEGRDAHVNSGMEAGAAETFDRLAEHLETMT